MFHIAAGAATHGISPGLKVAARLANRATFRIQVLYLVRRRSATRLHFRPYLKWLKSLGPSDLNLSPEDAYVSLTPGLVAISPPVAEWGRSATDEAALLIIDTWKVLLRRGSVADVRERNEEWARSRHQRIESLLDGGFPVSNPFAIESARRRSEARTSERLMTFALSPEVARELRAVLSAEPPSFSPGGLHVLVGPFGSGKSELAETWFRARLDEFAVESYAPFVVWIGAGSLARALDVELSDRLGRSDRSSLRGVNLVVDGLDEIEPARSAEIVREAREFLASSPRSRILFTARDAQGFRDSEISNVRLLGERAVDQVLHAITGHNTSSYSLPGGLRETARTPFFAVAAGLVLASGGRPGGPAGLIEQVLTIALRRPRDRVAVASEDADAVLRAVAIRATEGNGLVAANEFTAPQVERALLTRLVVRSGRHLRFSLPVFQQWFAAQEVLRDQLDPRRLVDDPHTFGVWRWPLAIATAAGTQAQTDTILVSIASRNPACAAWIVKSSTSNFYRGQADDAAESINSAEVGTRLVRAFQAMDQGLGDIAEFVLPRNTERRLPTLGIRSDESWIAMSWRRLPDAEPIVELPPSLDPIAGMSDDWMGYRWSRVGSDPAWLWTIVVDDVAAGIGNALVNERLPVEDDVWRREHTYAICRSLVGQSRHLHHRSVSADAVTGALSELLGGDADVVVFQHGPRVTRAELEKLRETLGEGDVGDVVRPWVVPDRLENPRGGGRYISDIYSEEQMRQLAFEVYTSAVELFRGLARRWFPSFGWALGWLADDRFGLMAEVHFPLRQDHPLPEPVLNSRILPIQMIDELTNGRNYLGRSGAAVRIAADHDDGPTLEELQSGIEQWTSEHGVNPFSGFVSSQGQLHLHGERPASRLAVQWLQEALRSFQLDRNSRIPDYW